MWQAPSATRYGHTSASASIGAIVAEPAERSPGRYGRGLPVAPDPDSLQTQSGREAMASVLPGLKALPPQTGPAASHILKLCSCIVLTAALALQAAIQGHFRCQNAA